MSASYGLNGCLSLELKIQEKQLAASFVTVTERTVKNVFDTEFHCGVHRLTKVCSGHYSHYTKLCLIIYIVCKEILPLWNLKTIPEIFNLGVSCSQAEAGIAQAV
jgi:hypothetical protein